MSKQSSNIDENIGMKVTVGRYIQVTENNELKCLFVCVGIIPALFGSHIPVISIAENQSFCTIHSLFLNRQHHTYIRVLHTYVYLIKGHFLKPITANKLFSRMTD